MKNLRNAPGFSLIELLIAVTIVAILSAIAYPSYVEQVRKSRRAEAQDALLGIAQREERFYAQNARYTSDLQNDLNYTVNGSGKLETDGGYYEVAITAANASSYTLEATPLGDQANDWVTGFRLDSTGKKQQQVDGSWVDGWTGH